MLKYTGVIGTTTNANQGMAYKLTINAPSRPTNCARRMFKINGSESSIAYVSDEKRFKMRPNGVTSKNWNFVCGN